MSYVTDTSIDVTLKPKVVTPTEAKAKIYEIWVENTKVYPDSRAMEIEPGKKITVTVWVQNVGTGAGKLWSELVYADTGESIPGGEAKVTTYNVGVNDVVAFYFTITMPNYELKMRVNAGHVK